MKAMVSVVIPNWNGREILRVALKAMDKVKLDRPIEVIVVDNGSTDGSRVMVPQDFPGVKLVTLDQNQGFCGACNAGFRQAKGTLVGLLNNDAIPDPQWLSEAVKVLESDPKIGLVASKVLQRDRPGYLDSVGDLVNVWGVGCQRGHDQKDTGQFDRVEEVPSASGCAAVYRKSMLDELGGFDERFFAYYEDLDLAWRARRKGWRCVYVPSARVVHMGGATSRKDGASRLYYIQRNQEWVLMKNLSGWERWRWAPHVLFVVGSWMKHSMTGQGGVMWKAKRDAWRGIFPGIFP